MCTVVIFLYKNFICSGKILIIFIWFLRFGKPVVKKLESSAMIKSDLFWPFWRNFKLICDQFSQNIILTEQKIVNKRKKSKPLKIFLIVFESYFGLGQNRKSEDFYGWIPTTKQLGEKNITESTRIRDFAKWQPKLTLKKVSVWLKNFQQSEIYLDNFADSRG